MSERKVNLEEILKLYCNVAEYDKETILKAIKHACTQILELAAENAEVHEELFIVDKQSILNTINQVE